MSEIRTIGPHRVTCASIEDPIVDTMLAGRTVRVLYSDPPWGDGNMKYWVTQNRKMTGKQFVPLTYEALVVRLIQLIQRYVRGHVFIETGLRWEAMLIHRLQTMAGLYDVKAHRMQYKSGSRLIENTMVSGITASHGQWKLPNLPDDGTPVEYIAHAIQAAGAKPGDLVLDPCCGMGYTARAALKTGMVFAGNEFNSVRLAKTIKALEASL